MINGYIKTKNRILLKTSFFNINILLIIVCLTLEMFLPVDYTKEIFILDLIKRILSVIIIYTSPLQCHSMYKYKMIPDKFFLALSSISIVAILISNIFSVNYYLYFIIYSLMGLAILYTLSIAFKAKYILKTTVESKLKRSMLLWVLSLMTVVILLSHDLSSFIALSGNQLSRRFHILPLAYMLICRIHYNNLKSILITPKDHNTVKVADFGVTKRENEVLELIIKGLKYNEVSDKLCISISTVKKHITNVYRKTNTSNKVELITLLRG